MKEIVAFIGPEGAGKTTTAKRLAKDLDLPYITTGDILRDLAANDPGPLGDECRDLFANHTYLSGKSLLEVLKNRFNQEDVQDGFVLDGGLRTIEETVGFPAVLEETGLADLPLNIIYLKIPESVSLERLVTGENARKRQDDTVEGIKNRLLEFYFLLDERLALIKEQKNWSLIVINAEPSLKEVYQQVRQALND